jgi:hypothetical protein
LDAAGEGGTWVEVVPMAADHSGLQVVGVPEQLLVPLAEKA